MNKDLSIYLDGIRISAAMTVFLGHAAGPLTGGFLWQLNSYLDAAVMVFFVLSGFVIAYVVDSKEKTTFDYFIARVSRLSSVVVPALILTVIADQIGLYFNEELYYGGPWSPPKNEPLNYILSLFLIQNIWHLNLQPGMNSPFWSLTFELSFYLLYASIIFSSGIKRIVLVILILLISGPDITFLFPIWLFGVAAYFIIKHNLAPLGTSPIGLVISLISLATLIYFTPWAQSNLTQKVPFLLAGRHFVADYFYGILFTIHLIYIIPLVKSLSPFLNFFSRIIVYLGGMTFSLYLFHRPLIQMFASFSDDLYSITNRSIVIIGTLAITFTIGHWCEKNKYLIKQHLIRIFKKP